MRENILDVEKSEQLRMYVVWLKQSATDARDTIDEPILRDPRVRQYWDGEGITGTYFAETDIAGMGYSGFVYDVYFVFGPGAAWTEEPPPPAGAGGPVLYEGENFLAALRRQL